METPQPTLTLDRLELRPLRELDAPELARLAGDARIAAMTLRIPHPYPVEEARQFALRTRTGWESNVHAVFAAVERGSGSLVGGIGLEFDLPHKRAELGYWVGVPYWGKGYATEMAQGLIDFGFRHMAFERIHAHAMGSNAASIRVLEKAGMTREGVLRRHVLKGERWEDMVVFGMLRSEWSRP